MRLHTQWINDAKYKEEIAMNSRSKRVVTGCQRPGNERSMEQEIRK